MSIRDVTDLEIYNEALRLLKKLYALLKKVPQSESHTTYQCKKCGTSIPSNIAEGWAKRFYAAELKRFLLIAIGSSDELVNHLRIIAITAPFLEVEALELSEEYKVLSKRMNSFRTRWQITR